MALSNKDPSLTQLLASLLLERRGWVIEDAWDADRCATGIRSSRSKARLVYVSTFDKKPGQYDYVCEVALKPGSVECDVVEEGTSVTRRVLLEAIERHLDAPEVDSE